jgi:hypothetical protein
LKKFLREPLVHFLAIGIGLFVLFDLVAPEESNLDSKTIVVDRDALLTFVQFRSKAFNPEVAAARLDALGDAELSMLIDDYVREEALHREALALGMDQNDYVIKQRLIQSLDRGVLRSEPGRLLRRSLRNVHARLFQQRPSRPGAGAPARRDQARRTQRRERAVFRKHAPR